MAARVDAEGTGVPSPTTKASDAPNPPAKAVAHAESLPLMVANVCPPKRGQFGQIQAVTTRIEKSFRARRRVGEHGPHCQPRRESNRCQLEVRAHAIIFADMPCCLEASERISDHGPRFMICPSRWSAVSVQHLKFDSLTGKKAPPHDDRYRARGIVRLIREDECGTGSCLRVLDLVLAKCTKNCQTDR